MSKHPKYAYEGLFLGGVGLVICMRVETGGVPRFQNLVLRLEDIDHDTLHEVDRFASMARRRLADPPWVDSPIPGIG